MKIKAYLYFPATDLAFKNLSTNSNSYTDIVKELYSIKHNLKKKSEYEIFYDSDNVRCFLEVAKGYVPDPYLTGITNQIQTIIGTKSTNVCNPRIRNSQFIYANWTINVTAVISPFVVSESAEDTLKDSDSEKTICICLGQSIAVEREELHIIKDITHVNSFPELINVSSTNSDAGFIKWMVTLPAGKFSLKNNKDFEPLNKFWPRTKERIYKHIQTGNYWYFDFFHKNNKIHYEVFDPTGDIYLGEADENGKIKPDTNIGNKKIGSIIQ